MIKFEKVAIPMSLVIAVSDPERTAAGHPRVPRLIATRMFGIAAPFASSARTLVAGEIAWPPVVVVGCVMNWICAPAGTTFAICTV